MAAAAAAGAQPGIVRRARRPVGWVAPGPRPAAPAPAHRPELWPGAGEDLCYLAGEWRILQRTGGHRYSLDDLLTAHHAAEACAGRPPPARALDLGCGIGSVLLFVAWRFPGARCLGLEAQPVSAAMARRSVAWNGADERCAIHDGDLRQAAALLAGEAPFDLVTGTPPYFPPGTGTESGKIQCAPCRFEHRGGVEAYCAAAAALLAPAGVFALCLPDEARVARAAAAHGLVVVRQRAVIPRAGKPPLFSLFTLARTGEREVLPPLVVRDERGNRTDDFIAVRAAMGMPP